MLRVNSILRFLDKISRAYILLFGLSDWEKLNRRPFNKNLDYAILSVEYFSLRKTSLQKERKFFLLFDK